ncbi:hypothetical protein ACNKHK_16095 [Shigella flexneri]
MQKQAELYRGKANADSTENPDLLVLEFAMIRQQGMARALTVAP